MSPSNTQSVWNEYVTAELSRVAPLLTSLGYALESEQPHLKGERFLMQAITTTSGKKLILLARREEDGMRVVLKATSDPAGRNELLHERKCREFLQRINFAYDVFLSPEELVFMEKEGITIVIHRFVEQESSFLERSTEEQFRYALDAFKAQERAHATTYRHMKQVRNVFETRSAREYIHSYQQFLTNISRSYDDQKITHLLSEALSQITYGEIDVERYCGFLTHVDFVPHNFRISDGKMYLLDHSSLRFGNKHEGWARFLNFMTLYNPELESYLTQYVRENRAVEEQRSLELMRMYRLGEIIWYYVRTLTVTEGDLRNLNEARVHFWSQVLGYVLQSKKLPESIRETYIQKRDHLRTMEEKERQQGLH